MAYSDYECPFCGKPLIEGTGRSILTLFRRRHWLVCSGRPHCDFAVLHDNRFPGTDLQPGDRCPRCGQGLKLLSVAMTNEPELRRYWLACTRQGCGFLRPHDGRAPIFMK
jgi:ssDNA-binding Zn-finger/Zn-ribbon topoisomerase 1